MFLLMIVDHCSGLRGLKEEIAVFTFVRTLPCQRLPYNNTVNVQHCHRYSTYWALESCYKYDYIFPIETT